jgi:ABC-type transport system substrate-binding protein
VSRTARIVLTGVLVAGALVVGGVALAANPAPTGPSSTVSVEQGGPAGLRPAQNVPDADCPYEGGETGAANASAIRL